MGDMTLSFKSPQFKIINILEPLASEDSNAIDKVQTEDGSYGIYVSCANYTLYKLCSMKMQAYVE